MGQLFLATALFAPPVAMVLVARAIRPGMNSWLVASSCLLAMLAAFIFAPGNIGVLILMVLLSAAIVGLVSAGGQWIAARLASVHAVWIIPVVIHLAALAENYREHVNYEGSEIAAVGGAGAAAAAGILGVYAGIALSFIVALCLLPLWLRKVRLRSLAS